MSIPQDCRYSKTHEWAKKEGDLFVIGISDFAQHELGDIVFVELPPVGSKFRAGEAFGVVESVKAASDLYMPIGGEIVETNDALVSEPALANSDPYGKAWMAKVKPSNPAEFNDLMDAAAYAEHIASEGSKH